MCGICGEYNFGTNRPVSLPDIHSMAAAISHRGPDDEGFYCRGPVGLGFRRLSIIDLAGGHQPMSDPEQKVWLIFNGEIYNFLELRRELEGSGHTFRTKSDTEVILHGYKRWGIDVLDRLNGMFGLALWDEGEQRLMLARDRMGIKPLYYRLESQRLLFGSEIRAITARDTEVPEVNVSAINLFMRYRYTPAPLTPFKGINKLAPGTRLVVERGTARIERWWKFKPVPFDPMPSAEQAEEQLADLYAKAVKRQLISDVPVGLFLSGGLDSGLLLALMSQTRSKWNTYSVGFGDGFGNDELTQASEIAAHFGAHNFQVKLSQQQFEDGLAKVVEAVEEPVAADSIVPMYFLCQRARQDVKVALMGQGPDELFGGYRRHLFARYGSLGRMVPKNLRFLMPRVFSRLTDKASVERMISAFEAEDGLQKYSNMFSQLPGRAVDDLFQAGILDADMDCELHNCWRDLLPLMPLSDDLSGLQFLELRSSLPDELLLYADKLSMAHALEVRVPYLDHEIVEYVERLSASFKVRNGSRKWLHRKLCRRLLPQHLVTRKKIGFETPSGSWLRQEKAGSYSDYLFDPESEMYRFLRYESVQALLLDHRQGQAVYSDFLFSLLAFEIWLRAQRSRVGTTAVSR